jgi:hypothetical protein
MPVTKQANQAPLAVRKVQNVQILDQNADDSKVRRTLASFCGLTVNAYMMWIFKAAEGVSSESQLFFHLLALVMLVVTVRERDASYLFTAFALFFVPYIVLAAGLSFYSIAAIASGIMVLGFQRGVTLQNITSGAADLAESLSQGNLRRRILKISEVDVDPELLLENDLKEFTDVEGELIKVRKSHKTAKPAMKGALQKIIDQVEELQVKHARVLARTAGLGSYLQNIDREKLSAELQGFEKQLAEEKDEVARAQIQATVDQRKKRFLKLNDLETGLNRVKMQKIQMRDLFDSLMDHMNSLKFADAMSLQASSDAMVKEVDSIRTGLEDLEKGLLEAEKLSRS